TMPPPPAPADRTGNAAAPTTAGSRRPAAAREPAGPADRAAESRNVLAVHKITNGWRARPPPTLVVDPSQPQILVEPVAGGNGPRSSPAAQAVPEGTSPVSPCRRVPPVSGPRRSEKRRVFKGRGATPVVRPVPAAQRSIRGLCGEFRGTSPGAC